MDRYKNVVVIGGGTGSFALLSGLKSRDVSITALVNMVDDGGSTGILRDELGVLPSGDTRQCLIALSEAPEELRELFNFRYSEGTFRGHSFGNIFLSTLEKITGDFAGAVKTAEDLLRIKGRVLPITLDDVRLKLELADGTVIRGEGNIDVADFVGKGSRPFLTLEPRAVLNPEAAEAMLAADLIIIAPGDLYTSLGPLLLVSGLTDVFKRCSATVTYVANLVVKPGHTTGMRVSQFAAEIERFAGYECLDYVLYNTGEPSSEALLRYVAQGELPVEVDRSVLDAAHYTAIGADLLNRTPATKRPGDLIKRSFIRHNAEALTETLLSLAPVK